MTALQAKRHTRTFLLKEVEKSLNASGDDHSYKAVLYPARRVGWSDFANVYMFIDGSEEQSREQIATFLEGVQDRTSITLDIVPGALRRDKNHSEKPDDGEFGNYFWNIVGVIDLAEQPVVNSPPQGEGQGEPESGERPPSAESAEEQFDQLGEGIRRKADEPGFEEPPVHKEEIPVDQMPRRHRNGKDKLDPISLSIDIGWAFNNAREFVQFLHSGPNGRPSAEKMLKEIYDQVPGWISMKRHLTRKYNNGEIT
jgi:hypothetical protein